MKKIITPLVTISLLISYVCYSQDNTGSPITINPNDTSKVGTSVAATYKSEAPDQMKENK